MTDISAAIGKPNPDFPQRTGHQLGRIIFQSRSERCTLGTNRTRVCAIRRLETLNRIATALDISFYELIGSVEEVPQKQPETNEIKRKIDAQLSSMTLDEQKDILRIIRIFRRRFDEENKKTD